MFKNSHPLSGYALCPAGCLSCTVREGVRYALPVLNVRHVVMVVIVSAG